MKLLIVGATGMIGSRLTAEAVARGHEVIAASRKGTEIDGASAVALDVVNLSALTAQGETVDIIVSAVSPRSTDDADSEAKASMQALISAAQVTGKRLMVVGGAGTLNLLDGTPVADVVPEIYRAEAKAMRAAYELLEDSAADYTFFAPAGEIAPGERTGTFRLGGRDFLTDTDGNSRISAEDYAVAFLDEIETPMHRRQVMTAAY